MNYRLVFRILGRILILEAAALLPALGVSLYYGDGTALAFVASIGILLVVGAGPALLLPKSTNSMRPREGFVTVALSWIFLSIFGALPAFISGVIPNYIDAVFEVISGFSTTGVSVLPFIEGLPEGIIFWRSFTQWLGGMGVLILVLAILPAGERGVYNLMRAEAPGPASERIVPRLRKTALILYAIYMVLSVLQTVFLICGGMGVFDSLINMFGTAGTGGFSDRDLSIGAYNSAYFDYVVGAFMVLFSVNYGLYFAAVSRRFMQVRKNTELKVFLGIILVSTALIVVNLMTSGVFKSFGDAARHSFFQVASLSSSTGFSTANIKLWPEFSQTLLLILMAIGACASSTGGGLKVIRVVMLFKSAMREMKKILHPRSVNVVHINGQAVPDKTLTVVMHYFCIYVLIIILATLLLSFDSAGFDSSFAGVLSIISNAGAGFGFNSAVSNFSGFSVFSKLVLSVCMLIGRLEIFPVLILVMPSTWKRA